jgi:hypothetical protein
MYARSLDTILDVYWFPFVSGSAWLFRLKNSAGAMAVMLGLA